MNLVDANVLLYAVAADGSDFGVDFGVDETDEVAAGLDVGFDAAAGGAGFDDSIESRP